MTHNSFYTLISTTNPKFTYLIGHVGQLKVTDTHPATFVTPTQWLITSNVQSSTQSDDTITINTLNSVYVFKLVD